MAIRPLPPDPRSRIARRRRRANTRARVLAALLALAGIACVVLGVGADPAPAAAPALRTAPRSIPTPLLSARRVPAIFVDAVSAGRLQRQIGAIVAPIDACVVVDERATPLVGINPDRPLAAASTQKLLVAAAALSVLGPTHQFATRAVSTGAVGGSELTGDLAIIGGGDPALTTAADPGPAATRLSDLADAIARTGITRISGALVADDNRYDGERTISDWTPAEVSEGDAGALGALAVNGGFRDGARATDPALDTVEQLAGLLSARNIEISGGVRHDAAGAPKNAHEIAHVDSPALSTIVEEMLTDSNNETAELLTRELGYKRTGTGTTASGTTAVRVALSHLGVPVTGIDLHDGSGLAPTDRVTCAALLRVIELSAHEPLSAIDHGLPIAGQTGTLRGRFTGTDLAGRLRAKTGHIDGVVGLSGLIDPRAGSAIEPRFAFIANGTFSTSGGAQLQDEIGAAIGAYPDAPNPADLVPKPQSPG